MRTCNSCISFSCNFVLKISFVIFSCSSSKCSGLNPLGLSSRLIGIDVVVLLLLLLLTLLFSLPLFDSLRWSACNLSSSNFGCFGGTDTNPRCKRFRSFSRMSMNIWENLRNAKYRKISAISRRRIDRSSNHRRKSQSAQAYIRAYNISRPIEALNRSHWLAEWRLQNSTDGYVVTIYGKLWAVYQRALDATYDNIDIDRWGLSLYVRACLPVPQRFKKHSLPQNPNAD